MCWRLVLACVAFFEQYEAVLNSYHYNFMTTNWGRWPKPFFVPSMSALPKE